MFCDRCGAQVLENQSFCGSCGKSFRPAPLVPPPPNRVAGNVRTLGICWLLYSAFRLVSGWFLTTMFPRFFDWWPRESAHFPLFLGGIVRGVGFLMMAHAVLGLIAGWGLLERHSWGRILAIVVAVLALLRIPLGTALGVYTLWVLLPAESEREYQAIARAG